MNERERWSGSRYALRSALAMLFGTVFLVGPVLAEDKPLDAAPVEGTVKPAPRVSPYVLAAQRRLQEDDDALQPRVGLQSQMRKNAVRHHHAPARPGA